MTPEQDEFRRRALRAILTVAGIAAVFGLVVGILTVGVVYMSGLDSADDTAPAVAEPEQGTDQNDDEIPSPSLKPTASPSARPGAGPSGPSGPSGQADTPTSKPSPEQSRSPKKTRSPREQRAIRLRAGAGSAAAYEEVTLSGSYAGRNGVTLQVQRFEGGGWAAFPTSATVDGGSFSTFVASGQSGPNRFRVVDPSGEASNVVTVNVS